MPKPQPVIDAVLSALQSCGNAARGIYPQALASISALYECREKLAALFNAPRADHVVFAPNVTTALNVALKGVLRAGDYVITDQSQHNSVLRPLYQLVREGRIALDIAPVDAQGRLDLAELEARLTPQTRALVSQHASNLTGNVFDLEALGAFAHEHGLLFVVDAAQTAGLVPLDMARMHIDILCFTGHKSLLGPQGTGGLCLREGLTLEPLISGGTGVASHSPTQPDAYPEHLEAGTLNSHGIAGLSAALDFIGSVGMDTLYHDATSLTSQFVAGLRSIPGVVTYGDLEARVRVPIVALNLAGYESYELSDLLSYEFGISTRPGAHCAPLLHEALGTAQTGSVRFSFGYGNTSADVAAALAALQELAARARERDLAHSSRR